MISQTKLAAVWSIVGLVIIATMAYGATLLFMSTSDISIEQTSAVNNVAFIYKPTSTASSTALWKLTCENLRPSVMKAIDDYNKTQKLEWKSGGATYGPGNYINQKKFYKVLYSPGLGQCIVVVIDQTLLQEGTALTVVEKSYGFWDATYAYLDWIDTIKHGWPYMSMAEVAQKIHEYETSTSSPINLANP